MSALAFTTEEKFETGDLVCINSVTGQAVSYDPEASYRVVGVAIKPTEGHTTNGRQWFAINGIPYYWNDMYLWQEDLTSDLTTYDEAYTPFNPLTDKGYITAITHGLAAVKQSIKGIPSEWILLEEGTKYNQYLIR